MKNIKLLLIALIFPFFVSAQIPDVPTIKTLELVGKAKISSDVKSAFKKAYLAAVCEIVNPWTGECDKWMDPEDPIPSTQGLQNQSDRDQAAKQFEKMLLYQKDGSVVVTHPQSGKPIDLKKAYASTRKDSKLKNPFMRTQVFCDNLHNMLTN